MWKKSKKAYSFIFVAFMIFVSLFLAKELFYNQALIEPVAVYENSAIVNSTSSAVQSVNIFQSTTTKQAGVVPQSKVVLNIADLSGQLVHHLFNINSVPSPKAAAFSPDGQEIWVTMLLNVKRGVVVFSSQTGEKIKDINLADGGGVEVIFSRDGKLAYVSQMETAEIFEIDGQTKTALRTFKTGSTWTKILEFSASSSTLFASNWVGNDISEIDLSLGKLLRLIPTVKTPRGIYATKDGNYLYVAGFDSGEIQKIDLKTGLGKIIYKSGRAMRHIAADEERGVLFISDMGKNVIWQVSLADDSVKKFVDTDVNPNTIVLSPDKKVLFVSCRGKNYSATDYSRSGPEWGSVLLFDAESGQMLDAIIGGNQPTALAISPDGKTLVFSDFLDSRLEVFAVPSYEVLLRGNGGRSGVYKAELEK
jgi:DNA-binding beta-propeller fold protein YncE